ncbi:GNAT family N-acetyltransferase [Flavobacterium selenitireducens]|uniref:GNAT family N-acetyltransferase n=1 Tax=Flavobacterium selenitireducens TaxID=2722704 RepID=UPI00168C0DA0|nr:GNAT family N-acetyltransferase [Flavobacterium selenitireducens]MBD3583742.1 GNAT family N-acetyltransferase [Flavobacterium selenitireducens]
MGIEFKIKRFEALSASELYRILQLRSEVFVVEQNCVYQDIDGKDEKAVHLFGESDGEIVAYARLFDKGDYFDETSIGRVVVSPNSRDKKYGHELMREAIQSIERLFGQTEIVISAQLYLQRFYESHGFVTEGITYLEDEIPHIRMKKA